MIEGWKQVKLADYYKISSGLSKSADQFGSGYPFVSFKDVFWNYFLPEDLTELVNTTEKEQVKCSVKKGDIFLTRTSEKVEELGMSCVALKDYPFATFNGFTKRLRPISDKIDPKFIGFYLRSPQFRAEITAYSTLTTRASLNNDIIGHLRINLPPLPTQRKIASILSTYDDLIENNLKRIKLLEEKTQLTYEEWFVRMKFPGHETTPINKETGLPEGWEKKKIVNFNSLSQYKKKVTKFEDEIEYLATANVDGIAITERGEMVNWVNKPSRAQILPPKESVWFARMSNTYKVLHFTKQTNNNVLLSSGFAGFIPKNSNCLAFLFCMIKSEKFDLQKNMYASGSTQVSLNNQGLSLMNEIEPSLELIEKFGEICLNNLEEIHVLYNQNQLLKEARDILLPRLMTGMINVEKMKLENLQPTTA